MTTAKKTAHLELLPANIPGFLKAHSRWAPFTLQLNTRRNKYDKIPKRADNVQANLSTNAPTRWFNFDAAVEAYHRHPGVVHGVGYCLTGPHGVVGVDMDGCSDTAGKPIDWALDVLHEALARGYYCERSPSGRGFHVFYEGKSDDWTDHDVGIEVYGGHGARFLTVTGHLITEVTR
jgi:primase-polymerase (primpol)-like protein